MALGCFNMLKVKDIIKHIREHGAVNLSGLLFKGLFLPLANAGEKKAQNTRVDLTKEQGIGRRTFSKKAVVFTTDAGIALFLSLVIVLSTNFFIAKTEEQFWTKYHFFKSAQDTVSVLDYNGTIQKTSADELAMTLAMMSEPDASTYFAVSCSDSTNFEIGEPPREKKFVFSDKYVFVTMDEENIEKMCTIDYKVWVK